MTQHWQHEIQSGRERETIFFKYNFCKHREQLHPISFIYFIFVVGTKIKLKTRPVYLNTQFINTETMSS